ncbi:hypothetical protein [Stenotrophomonas indicatrix]|uniref:hypothetical protein n=1 Tax=Stenotrophomonas indicatrix TaxID=2045451 RepID=UPI000FDB50EE|nr:hypothetical protein [Stenotrophomonas indicatrix]
MAEEDLTITGKELASLIGCKPSYVVELRKKGRVVVGAGGKGFLKAASLELYARTADPVYAGVAQRHADERGNSLVGSGERAGAVDADIDDEKEDGDDDDTRPARPGRPQTPDSARKAKALADKAETDAHMAHITLQKELGLLLPRADVEAFLAEHATTFRGAMERLADTLAPQLAATLDEAGCRRLVWDEVSHALEELSQGFRTLATKAAEAAE